MKTKIDNSGRFLYSIRLYPLEIASGYVVCSTQKGFIGLGTSFRKPKKETNINNMQENWGILLFL